MSQIDKILKSKVQKTNQSWHAWPSLLQTQKHVIHVFICLNYNESYVFLLFFVLFVSSTNHIICHLVMAMLQNALQTISNTDFSARMATTWGSLYNLAKRVLLLALNHPAIKIFYRSKQTNTACMQSRTKREVVMTEIKVIKAVNCGKVVHVQSVEHRKGLCTWK